MATLNHTIPYKIAIT